MFKKNKMSKTNFNTEVAKIRSLIERMNGNMTPYEAMLNEEKLIQEANTPVIKESVNNILSELDWRTADIAHKQAMSKANDNHYNKYQRAKYLRQGKNFEKYRNDKFNTQYNLQGVDGYNNLDTDDLANSQLTTGQLKQLGKRKNDINNWISGNTEYRNGEWRNKNTSDADVDEDYPSFTM